jgi:SSS family solute:Na+ symporter
LRRSSALGSLIGFCARGRHRMDLEQWTVGGRSFGLLIIWLMMAGEIYTTAAFLGTSGWVYSKGAPSLYIIAYLVLGNVTAYFLSPAIWRVGQARGLQTQADFFQVVYGSRPLGALVAVVGIAGIIPYLQLQLTGLGIIVSVASFGGISQALAMTLAATLIAGFVLASGIRAVAGMSILKDLLMVGVVVFVGAAVPHILFGGVGPMFARVAAAHPDHLTMPGPIPAFGHGWFVTMVLLSALGQIIWPHGFGSIFSARSGETIRRNAVILPLYNLTLPFSFFVGYAALLAMPGLADSNLAFMTVVKSIFPPWFLGSSRRCRGAGRDGARVDHAPDRGDPLREERRPSDPRPVAWGCPCGPVGPVPPRRPHGPQPVVRASQLGDAPGAAPAGLRDGGPVLSGDLFRAVLEAGAAASPCSRGL